MQILGSPVLLSHSSVSEPSWERTLPVVAPPAAKTEAEALIERPVTRTARTEESSYQRPYSAPVRTLAGDGYARRALAAYESTQRLERRDDLRAFQGIDAYA